MKQIIFPLLLLAATALNCTAQQPKQETYQQIDTVATVYMTRDISPESLVRIYKALGVKAKGRVAIKISTGESNKTKATTSLCALFSENRMSISVQSIEL